MAVKKDRKTSWFSDFNIFKRQCIYRSYKGCSILNSMWKGYNLSIKGYLFGQKWYIHVKREGVGPQGGAALYDIFFSTPFPGKGACCFSREVTVWLPTTLWNLFISDTFRENLLTCTQTLFIFLFIPPCTGRQ